MFEAFRAQRLWYFNVELGFAAVTGILTGLTLATTNPCEVNTLGWIIAAVGAAEVLTATYFQPYSARIDILVLWCVNGLSVLSEVIAMASTNDAGQSASNAFGLLAAAIQLLAMLILGIDVVARFHGCQ